MKAIVNVLNGILGAGTNRRSSTPTPRVDDATRVWEVRPKYETKRGMTPIKDKALRRR